MNIAIGVIVFHLLWIGVLLVCPFLPKRFGMWKTFPTTVTLVSQVIFLGCPLTLWATSLGGEPRGMSFTVWLLKKAGVPIAEWEIFVALAVITGGTFFIVTRQAMAEGRREAQD